MVDKKLVVDLRKIQELELSHLKVKRMGCSTLKELLEKDHLFIEDFDIISELMTFAEKGTSYQAEEGYNDDLVMCLVLFGWLVNQRYFKEITNSDIRKELLEQQERMNERTFPSFRFLQ